VQGGPAISATNAPNSKINANSKLQKNSEKPGGDRSYWVVTTLQERLLGVNIEHKSKNDRGERNPDKFRQRETKKKITVKPREKFQPPNGGGQKGAAPGQKKKTVIGRQYSGTHVPQNSEDDHKKEKRIKVSSQKDKHVLGGKGALALNTKGTVQPRKKRMARTMFDLKKKHRITRMP